MRHTATTSTLAALVGAAVLVAPSAAVAADTQLGATDTPTFACGGGLTAFQTTSPGSTYSTPSAGVITSWRILGGAASSVRSFKVGRGSVSSVAVVGTSSPTTIPAGQLTEGKVRIPVLAGDFLGFSLISGDDRCATSTSEPAYTFAAFVGDSQPGPAAPPAASGGGFKFDVAATLEPDADGDGFGDTTQDACPTQAGTQGACKDTTAPQTTITKAKAAKLKGRAKKAKVTVAFKANEAATFGCSVDGSAYKKCTSPLVRRLGAGKHTVKVRATDAAGNTDATPASKTVRVKRAR